MPPAAPDRFETMDDGTPLGRITNLWRYPIKSLRAEALTSAQVGPDGLAGDRRRALLVQTPEHARYGKPYRGKEHELLHTAASVADATRIARTSGVAVESADDGPFFDAAPISLLFDRWLAQAEQLTGLELEPLRFRPNLFVRADAAFAARESELVGVALRAGSVRLRVRAPITRCVTITYDVATGTPTPSVLRDLADFRETILGVYADVLTPGTIAAGDMLWHVNERSA